MHGGGAIAKANPEGRTRVDFGGHVRTPGGGVPLGLWFWLPSMRPWGRLETFVLCYAGPIGLAGGSPCAFAHVQRHGRDGCQSRWARAAVCFFGSRAIGRQPRCVFGSSAVQFGIMLKPRRATIGPLGIVWADGCGGG